MWRALTSIVRSPIVRWVAGVTLLMTALLVWRPTFTETFELKLYDLKFRYRGPKTPGPEVVIVAIDDDSLKAVGRWPWSREDFAKFLAKVKEAGPRVIALDIIFAEKQETAALRTLNHLEQEMIRRRMASREIQALLEEEKKLADVDRQLAAVLAQKPPTILGFFFRGVGGVTGETESSRLLGASFISASTYNMVRYIDTEPSRLPLLGAAAVELNLPVITAAAAGDGYFNMIPDQDGTIRWLPLTLLYGPDVFAPMSLVTVAHYLERPPLSLTLSRLGVEEIRLGKRIIPCDRFGRLLINYLGPPGRIPTFSAAAVIEGRLPPHVLKDKIVLVGATAVGIYDLRVTPFSGVCPGVEIQATVMDNLLQGNFLRPLPWALPLSLFTVLILGVLMGVVLPRLSAAWGFLFTFVLMEIYIAGNYLMFRSGRQMELFYPLAEIVLVYLGITMQRFLAEEKERVRIRQAFESYVAPAIVQDMLKNPERLRLGGERREISILFSDIRGFTTMSEELAPEALVKLLHDFLNPMSNIIINQGGTIDKYMGDAIMALFGAPLEQPGHAGQACRAALEMVTTLERLNREWEAQGRPPLAVGIGVNTGVVAVGNMGSDRLFDYTAVGDNVNLASRLEGLNKYYGTSIIISQATAEALDGILIIRDLDRVRVKGKGQASGIFEVMGEGEPSPELARFLELYHQGLALYRERQWRESAPIFQTALELRPRDPLSSRYLKLALNYLETAPGPEWEAVTRMDEK
ncbi:MAG: adenylate/guanylate cyclase domain-containing protein [Deltaproteobacteria bacterium]|nr:adenylate/guanylate cyclase domain-containing protein [Deltaproteobacteria bacterium]